MMVMSMMKLEEIYDQDGDDNDNGNHVDDDDDDGCYLLEYN